MGTSALLLAGLVVGLANVASAAKLAVLWRRENGAMDSLGWDGVACAAVLAVSASPSPSPRLSIECQLHSRTHSHPRPSTLDLTLTFNLARGLSPPASDAPRQVNHFNARNGSIAPEFATVPLGLQIEGLYYDAWSTGKDATIAYRKAIADGANAIAGPSRSAQALPVSGLAAIDEVVVVSPWASSPRLSIAAEHPYFSRTWPDDKMAAGLIMSAMSDFGWKNIGYVGVFDAYADGFKEAMNAWSAVNPGRAVLNPTPSFPFDNREAARNAVKALKALGTKVNVVIVFDEDIYAIMEAADELGMLGDEYIWVASDTTSDASTGTSYIPPGGSAAKLAGWLRGMIRLCFSPEGEKPAGYQRLQTVWAATTPSDCAFTPNPNNDSSHFVPTQAVFDRVPYDVAATMYDAVAVSALALAASDDPTNGSEARS